MAKKREIISIAFIVLSFIIAFYFYPQMPDKMASHWNIQGKVDGYMPKFWGLFLMPIISVGIFLLSILIPKIDPLKANIEKFRKYFDTFITFIIAFLFYIYILTIIWNKGTEFNMTYALVPVLAVLFYYIGILLEKAKRNWFIGIKTPWTLSNDVVWDKTHKLGSKIFKAAAFIFLLLIFLPKYLFLLLLILLIGLVIFLLVYSYFLYEKEARKKGAKAGKLWGR